MYQYVVQHEEEEAAVASDNEDIPYDYGEDDCVVIDKTSDDSADVAFESRQTASGSAAGGPHDGSSLKSKDLETTAIHRSKTVTSRHKMNTSMPVTAFDTNSKRKRNVRQRSSSLASCTLPSGDKKLSSVPFYSSLSEFHRQSSYLLIKICTTNRDL